jgi:hypothetical protein
VVVRFFARFFATRPDFAAPDSALPAEPGSPAWDAATTLSPAQRKAFYAVVRLAGAHLPLPQRQRLLAGYRASAAQGGSAAEVLAAGFEDDDDLQALSQRVFVLAEPGRLREALAELQAHQQALGLAGELPGAVRAAPDVEAALQAYAEALRGTGHEARFVDTGGEAWCLLATPAAEAGALRQAAAACGLVLGERAAGG